MAIRCVCFFRPDSEGLGSSAGAGKGPDAPLLDDDLNTPVYEFTDTGPQLQVGAGSLNLGGGQDALNAGSLNLGGGGDLLNDDIGLDLAGDDDDIGL